VDDIHLARARRRLEKSIEGLETRVQIDSDYDQRRELLDADLLRGEAAEILTHYEKPEDFWNDYLKVREADPTLPAFERFLRFHVDGRSSETARQHRFNRLFLEAHELFVSRDRANYVTNHLKQATL
jgi:hypothetical protein